MVLFLMWRAMTMGAGHDILHYGASAGVPLSDSNGVGSFWQGAWTLWRCCGALAPLLVLAAHLLWRRGTEVRLTPRLALARRRLAGPAGWIAGVALLLFTASGAYAYYNTNILNDYVTADEGEALAVAFEKQYGKYIG